MNKKLIEEVNHAIGMSNLYGLDTSKEVLKAINDAGFVVVPKEPTEALALSFWNALPEEEYGSSSVKVINIYTFKWGYKAMIEASQEEME